MTLKEELGQLLIKKFMHYYDAGMNMWTIVPSDDANNICNFIEAKIKEARIDELHKLRQTLNPYQMGVDDFVRALADSIVMNTISLRIKELEGVKK